MEMSSLFSWNTDNLFKFLFINGIVLVVISLFYPLQKQQELELEKIKYDQKVELINIKISNLKNEMETFNLTSKAIELKIDSLKKISINLNTSNKIKTLKEQFNSTFNNIDKLKKDIEIEELNIKSDKAKIKILIKHAEEYRQYSNWFFRAGLISFFIGLIGWSWMTLVNESFKKEELKKIKRENNNG
ncbi:hypothetical protein [Flavobacterium sp.]|uniref:hypothetical protein n=1 Tax=Flavobacterium sp. TaxID=239 RepID=UPI00286EF2CF|nr:hypothetical protein [Flavobacterium sp.]